MRKMVISTSASILESTFLTQVERDLCAALTTIPASGWTICVIGSTVRRPLLLFVSTQNYVPGIGVHSAYTAKGGDIGEDLFYQFVNREWKAGCVWFRGNEAATGGIYEASFELGASCSHDEPANLNCGRANYDVEIAGFHF